MTKDLKFKNIAAGLLVSLIGLAVVFASTGYRLGTASHMGPGYFPLTLGILMVLIGVCVAVTEARTEASFMEPSYRAAILVIMSIVAFSAMIKPFGIVPTVLATVILSSLADPKSKISTSILTGLFMSAVVIVVFKYGLGFQASIFALGDYLRLGE